MKKIKLYTSILILVLILNRNVNATSMKDKLNDAREIGNDISLINVRLDQKERNLFVYVHVQGITNTVKCILLIDADNNEKTGYFYKRYAIGAEFLVENNALKKYNSNENKKKWKWKWIARISKKIQKTGEDNAVIQYKLPLKNLELTLKSSFKLRVITLDKKYKPDDYFPDLQMLEISIPKLKPENSFTKVYPVKKMVIFENVPGNIFKAPSSIKDLSGKGTPGWHNDKALGDHLDEPQNNLLINSGFENGSPLEGWAYSLHDGAKGVVLWDNNRSRSGKKSLKIIKENSAGYIKVFSTRPVKKDSSYMNLAASGYYYTENSFPEYCAGFIRLDYGKGVTFYRNECEGRQIGLINSSGNLWNKRFFYTKNLPELTKSVRINIISIGNPHTIWWDDICLEYREKADQRFKKEIAYRPTPLKNSFISKNKLQKIIKLDKNHESWLEKRNGNTRLIIDGKVVVPSVYKKTDKMTKENSSAGILSKYNQNLGVTSIDFSKELWKTKDKYDLSSAIAKVEHAMREAPNMLFIITFKLNPYPGFAEDYPNEIWLNKNKQKGSGHSIHILNWGIKPANGHHYWSSYFSQIYQNGIKIGIKKIILALKAKGYLKRVIGFHISGGHDGQFALRRMDYSLPAEKAFRKWLKKKYGTIEKLSKAWGKQINAFNSINAPVFPKKGIFYNPTTDRAFVDFHKFQKLELFAIQNRFAACIKKYAGKRVITLHWCMEPYGGVQHGAHYIDDFLASKNMDILVAHQEYLKRLPGTTFSFHMPLGAFNKNKKLMFSEIDLRTYITGDGMYRRSVFGPGYRSRVESFASWQSTVRRMIGEMIAKNQGYWFYEIANGTFADEALAKDIEDISNIYKKLINKKSKSVAKAAVIYDQESMFWTQLPHMRWHNLMIFNSYDQLSILSYSGVPFDVFTMKHIQNNPEIIKKYRLFLFLNAHYIDQQKQDFISSHLKCNENYLVFLSGAGNIFPENGLLKTTGFNAKYDDRTLDQFIIPQANNSPFKQLPLPSATFVQSYSLTLGENYKNYWGKHFTPVKLNIDPLSDNEILSIYRDTRKAALAIKKMNGWTSILIGQAAGIDPLFFNSIAQQAGAFVASKPGLIINMNSNFISIHAIKSGIYTINLPQKANKVINLFNGHIEEKNSSSFVLNAKAQTSYWFLVE
jgi:hypothetical protein